MSKANRKREFLKRKAKQANDDNNEEEITPQIFMDSLTEDERLLIGDEIQVDLELFDPKEIDYHSICTYLKNYLGTTYYDYFSVAEHVIKQFWVGSVIKVEGSEDTFGFLSLLPFSTPVPSLSTIKNFFLKQQSESDKEVLESYFSGEKGKSALILSERMEGIPFELIPHLYAQFFQEIKVEHEYEISEKMEAELDIENFLIFCPVYYLTASAAATNKNNSNKRSKQSITSNEENTVDNVERYFIHPEEELFEQFAIHSFTYHFVQQTSNDEVNFRPLLEGRLVREERLLLVIPQSSVRSLLSQLREF